MIPSNSTSSLLYRVRVRDPVLSARPSPFSPSARVSLRIILIKSPVNNGSEARVLTTLRIFDCFRFHTSSFSLVVTVRRSSLQWTPTLPNFQYPREDIGNTAASGFRSEVIRVGSHARLRTDGTVPLYHA